MDHHETSLAVNHLRAAVRNALILMPTVFFIGVLTGWALSHYNRAPNGALVGSLVGLGFLIWLTRLYYLTRGLLHQAAESR
jgi:hypothetical protein